MNRNDRRTRADRTDDRPSRTDDPITDAPTTDDPITGRSMRDVSHSHPFADRGALNRVFERGTRVVADGGERGGREPEEREYDARDPEEGADEERENDGTRKARMKDIDHTPPYGEGVDRVFERGGEEEPVEAEE